MDTLKIFIDIAFSYIQLLSQILNIFYNDMTCKIIKLYLLSFLILFHIFFLYSHSIFIIYII